MEAVTAHNSKIIHSESVSAPPRFWAIQLVGWSFFIIVEIAGAFSLPQRRVALAYYGVYSVAVAVCSIPLWFLCQWLWRTRKSWLITSLAVISASYGLAYLSFIAATSAEYRVSPPGAYPFSLHAWLLWSITGCLFGTFIYLAWAGLYFGTKFWSEAHRREQDSLRVESLAREAELRALRHELTPHFLLNTLNGISTLVGEERTDDARRVIALLGDFLRTTLATAGAGDVSLAHEFRHIEQYLAIERIRFEDRLSARLVLEPGVQDGLVPNLLLQPLVENALHHGIGSSTERGEIEIVARLDHGRVNIAIANTIQPIRCGATPGSTLSLGLELTRERLAARFGDNQQMVTSEADGRWLVSMTFPFESLHEAPA
jgi:Histidine kinase